MKNLAKNLFKKVKDIMSNNNVQIAAAVSTGVFLMIAGDKMLSIVDPFPSENKFIGATANADATYSGITDSFIKSGLSATDSLQRYGMSLDSAKKLMTDTSKTYGNVWKSASHTPLKVF